VRRRRRAFSASRCAPLRCAAQAVKAPARAGCRPAPLRSQIERALCPRPRISLGVRAPPVSFPQRRPLRSASSRPSQVKTKTPAPRSAPAPRSSAAPRPRAPGKSRVQHWRPRYETGVLPQNTHCPKSWTTRAKHAIQHTRGCAGRKISAQNRRFPLYRNARKPVNRETA
jgi:hypothetical protein